MILKAYSKGLYSNWFFYAPDRLLFDCGEGASLFLKQGIFAVEKIFLSHGHIDHVAGLYSFLCLRQSTKGDTSKALTIYYPEKDKTISILKDSLQKMVGHFVKYKLEWVGLKPGDQIQLKKDRFINVFSTIHSANDPVGFSVCEPRKRLKPELAGLPGQKLAKMSKDDKFDYYDAKLLCYTGDSMPLPADTFRDTQILIHDSTFLDVDDRTASTHASSQEAFDTAHNANVGKLVLCHISPRYHSRKRIESMLAKNETYGIDYCWIQPGRVFEI